MVKRLTEQKTTKGITRVVVRSCVCEFQTVLNKLCAFEDIMEKYGIESVEELDVLLEGMKKIWQDTCDAKNDRDTWQKACELACEREDDCYVYDNIHRAYEFYQQAKMEKETK